MDSIIYCRSCGEKNPGNNYKCTRCGIELHQSVRPAAVVDDSLCVLIPYKNTAALCSYYLGVAALIPVLGFLPGIAAVVTGLRGLAFVRQHPSAKGRVHAWVGLVLGALCTTGSILLMIGVVMLLSE